MDVTEHPLLSVSEMAKRLHWPRGVSDDGQSVA